MEWPNNDVSMVDINNAFRGTLMSHELTMDISKLLSDAFSTSIEGFQVSDKDYELPNDAVKVFLPTEDMATIKTILNIIYGGTQFKIMSRVTLLKEILYMGENFQTESFISHNNMVAARWLSNDNKIEVSSKGYRCGKIEKKSSRSTFENLTVVTNVKFYSK